MAKKPVTNKEPIMWEHRYWSYRETGMGGASHRSCGGLFVFLKMKKYSTKHGFVQIPLLIGIIFVMSLTTGAASYFGAKYFELGRQQQVEKIEKENLVEPVEKVRGVQQQPTKEVSNLPQAPQKANNENLKIAKCEAVRKTTRATVITKIDELFNKTEKDEFNRIQQEMYRRFDEVYAVSDRNKSAILGSGLYLAPDVGTSALTSNTADTKMMLDQIQASSQIEWNNKKNELMVARQTSINKADELLNKDYLACLNL